MTETRTSTLLLMLMAIIILLMIAIAGLFLRMNQLQGQVLAALSSGADGAPAQELGLPAGTAAPDFTLPDLAGKPVSLKDFAGKPVLLAFSSTTCPACQKTYPHLKAFSEARRDIQVVMISRGTAEENQRMVTEQGFTFPVLAWDDAVAQQYKAPGTPFFVAVDGQGVITASGFANTQVELHRLVADGLGEGRCGAFIKGKIKLPFNNALKIVYEHQEVIHETLNPVYPYDFAKCFASACSHCVG